MTSAAYVATDSSTPKFHAEHGLHRRVLRPQNIWRGTIDSRRKTDAVHAITGHGSAIRTCQKNTAHHAVLRSICATRFHREQRAGAELPQSRQAVKFSFIWCIFNVVVLVRNKLRRKASCYTDKSLFSVAIVARIWLYVGLCCDAGGSDSGHSTGCGNTSESSDTNELTLGEYFYESDINTKGLPRRGLRHRIRGMHRPQADPGADR
jgi:hypothetical protein